MIALAGATALLLASLQAGINAPRNAFNDCLKQSSAEAKAQNVPAEGFQAYVDNACSAQIAAFKKASVAFDVGNGIGRKQASEDADLMISDWVNGAVEGYKSRAAGPTAK